MPHSKVKNAVEKWLTSVVIDLNLCPFAQREYRQEKIHFSICDSVSEADIVEHLVRELLALHKDTQVETTLLILSKSLIEFSLFNDFLDMADTVLDDMKLDGVFQIASFHPDYQFAGTQVDDAENYTNRSPYPILHLLRESSLDSAIDRHPDTSQIPHDNIDLMNKLGNQHMDSLLKKCLLDNG